MTDETPDVVSRARAALDSITPGQWEVGRALLDDSEHHFVSPTGGLDGSILGFTDAVADYCGPDDAAFIAASPNLVRDLIAKVEKLEGALEGSNRSRQLLIDERSGLRAEVERLTAERDQAIAAHQRAEARATLHREERVRRALGEADRD